MKYPLISDYILVQNVIPGEVCKEFIQNINPEDWSEHKWTDPLQGMVRQTDYEKEPEVVYSKPSFVEKFKPYIYEAITKYCEIYSPQILTSCTFASRMSGIRLNRYDVGKELRPHYDHVKSLFDGNEKGIPILSIVGNLNEGYEGGELQFFGEKSYALGEGDIIIFPSCFMYPHQVLEVKKGSRYSFVCWAY